MNEIKPVMSMFANELDCLRARDQWLHDRIATLERELAESKAREEQLRLDAARWALFRDTPSGTFDQYKDEWRFRCNVIGGMWCKSKDDAMDYALSKLQPSGHITQKGDTNADA